MAVTWVNYIAGAPLARDFVTTSGLGPALCVDTTTGILYFLTSTGKVIPIVGRRFQPEIFGAVGDGATDDYPAFVALKVAVNAAGGGEIDFRQGATYFINRYVGDGLGTAANDMMFDGLNFLKINGNGATISTFGAFNRAVNATQPLSGFKVRNSFRVTVRDLIVTGNVQSMTRAGGVTESSVACCNINGCDLVHLENLDLGNGPTDGLKVDGYFNGVSGRASRRLTGNNIRCHNNARNAASLTQLRDFKFTSCSFDDSGQSIGTYTQHSPCSSLDIEPNFTTTSGGTTQMDVNTGNGVFESCEFNNSNRNIISALLPAAIDNIVFRNCKGYAPAGLSSSVNAIYFDVEKGLMDNCYWDCQDQAFALTSSSSDAAKSIIELRSTTVKANKDIIHCNNVAASVRVSKCKLINAAAAPLTIGGSKNWVLQLTSAALIFEDNDIFVPKEAYHNEGVGDFHVIMDTGSGVRFNLNRWTTDLPANQSGAATAHFANAFIAGSTTPIFSDKYTGQAPGTTDTYRPTKNDVFNTTGYYDRNH